MGLRRDHWKGILTGLVLASIAVATAGSGIAQDTRPPSTVGRDQRDWPPFARGAYTERLKALGLDGDELRRFESIDEPGELALEADRLLRTLVPELRDAMALAVDRDPRALLDLMALVEDDERPIIRAHATFHAARLVQEAGDAERAIDLWAEFLRREPGRTPLDAEATFHYAEATADSGQKELAERAFAIFLGRFPKAPEVFRTTAAKRRAELAARGETPLHGLVDDMTEVGRRLRSGETGDATQARQKAITESLERILEQIEEEEQKRNDSAQNTQTSTSPASESRLPGGRSEIGTLTAPSNIADRWGDVRDRERAEILNEIQTRFRGRTRDLLEGYYRRLSEGQDR